MKFFSFVGSAFLDPWRFSDTAVTLDGTQSVVPSPSKNRETDLKTSSIRSILRLLGEKIRPKGSLIPQNPALWLGFVSPFLHQARTTGIILPTDKFRG